jgi:hypothetical protein
MQLRTKIRRQSTTILLGALLFTACQPPGLENEPPAMSAEQAATRTAVPPAAVTSPTAYSLDLREANILDVESEMIASGTFRFDVTLIHDDDGESPSYADRWVVEDLAGNLLGERILLHAHGSRPFTRSEAILVPDGITIVLVRAHDQRHGFGGQALRLNLESGQTQVVQDADGP